MIRTFQPVGQGVFVTEHFEQGQNVVFDCGSLTSLGLVRKLIQTNYDEKELIDAVFISSLDNEHAGGLEALMQWCRVTKVFIPYLNEDERAYTLLKHLCEGGEPDDFLSRLITEPKEALSAYQILDPRMPVVTQIAPEVGWERNVFDANMPIDLMPWKAIEGFRVYVDPQLDWIYQARVYRQRRALDELTAALIAAGEDPGWIATAATVQRAWRQNPTRKALMQVYRQQKDHSCVVSMALYSGPQTLDYRMYEQYTEQGKWNYHTKMRCGGIYTGELHLRDENLRADFLRHFGDYRPRVGSFLLPGHGADTLFHETVLPGRNAIVVTTADTENVLCLPHGKVVHAVLDRKLPFYVVTEVPGSIARFAVNERVK